MPIILSPSANPFCNDWNNNFGIVNTSLLNAEILNQGLLTLTRNDGTTFTNPIPFFIDHVTSGLATSLSDLPNPRSFVYTSGTYQIGVSQYTITPGSNFQINAGNLTNPRVDIVYLTTTNTLVYLPGIAAANPVAPTPPANTLILAYIGVNANATTIAGITLTQVNVGTATSLAPGILINQTLRWNGSAWVPNSSMLANGLKVSIAGISGLGALDAITKLQVGGAINIEPNAAPFPVTDKLYNVAGQLYWNGNLLTGPTGTTIGSHLRWNGTAFVEETQFLTTTLGGAAWLSSFVNTNAAGLLTRTNLGQSFITTQRGSTMYVNDTLNLKDGYLDLSAQAGLTPEIRLVVNDNNIGAQTKYFQDDNEIKITNFNGSTTGEVEITPTHTIFRGGQVITQRNSAVNIAVTANDYMIVSTATLTATLPLAPNNGETHIFKSRGGTMTVNGNGKNIDTAATTTVPLNSSRTLVFNSALNIWTIN
jgi:hypothetical protein